MKLLHIHLFKNAGTSIINLFKNQLDEKYILDLEAEYKKFNTYVEKDELYTAEKKYPKKFFFTAHNIEPCLEGVFLNLMPLRHPLNRALSVYNYEVMQGENGAQNPGPKKAIELSSEEYFKWRLNLNTNGVICNFQIASVLGLRNIRKKVIDENDLILAKKYYEKYFFNFIVEDFKYYQSRLAQMIRNETDLTFNISFTPQDNAFGSNHDTNEVKKILKDMMTKQTFKNFLERNKADLDFYNYFKRYE